LVALQSDDDAVDDLIGFSESPEAVNRFAPTIRTFLHFFTFLNATPAQSDLDTWNTCLATLDDQLRANLLATISTS
jgi:hypothetical protein